MCCSWYVLSSRRKLSECVEWVGMGDRVTELLVKAPRQCHCWIELYANSQQLRLTDKKWMRHSFKNTSALGARVEYTTKDKKQNANRLNGRVVAQHTFAICRSILARLRTWIDLSLRESKVKNPFYGFICNWRDDFESAEFVVLHTSPRSWLSLVLYAHTHTHTTLRHRERSETWDLFGIARIFCRSRSLVSHLVWLIMTILELEHWRELCAHTLHVLCVFCLRLLLLWVAVVVSVVPIPAKARQKTVMNVISLLKFRVCGGYIFVWAWNRNNNNHKKRTTTTTKERATIA